MLNGKLQLLCRSQQHQVTLNSAPAGAGLAKLQARQAVYLARLVLAVIAFQHRASDDLFKGLKVNFDSRLPERSLLKQELAYGGNRRIQLLLPETDANQSAPLP